MYTQIFKIKYLRFEFVKILRSRIHVYIQVCTRFYEKIEEKSELIGKNFFYKILKVQRNFYIRYSIQNFWFLINRESKLTTKYKSFLFASIFNKLNKRPTQQKKCIATFLNQFTPINDRKKKNLNIGVVWGTLRTNIATKTLSRLCRWKFAQNRRDN